MIAVQARERLHCLGSNLAQPSSSTAASVAVRTLLRNKQTAAEPTFGGEFSTIEGSEGITSGRADVSQRVEHWRSEPLESQITRRSGEHSGPLEVTEVEKRQRLPPQTVFLEHRFEKLALGFVQQEALVVHVDFGNHSPLLAVQQDAASLATCPSLELPSGSRVVSFR